MEGVANSVHFKSAIFGFFILNCSLSDIGVRRPAVRSKVHVLSENLTLFNVFYHITDSVTLIHQFALYLNTFVGINSNFVVLRCSAVKKMHFTISQWSVCSDPRSKVKLLSFFRHKASTGMYKCLLWGLQLVTLPHQNYLSQ